MVEKFKLIIADDSEHEKVFVEIYVENIFLALVSQENGPDKLLLELPGLGLDENLIARQVKLYEFIEVLKQAAMELVGEIDI